MDGVDRNRTTGLTRVTFLRDLPFCHPHNTQWGAADTSNSDSLLNSEHISKMCPLGCVCTVVITKIPVPHFSELLKREN